MKLSKFLDAVYILQPKRFYSTKKLAKDLDITHEAASILFRKLDWTKYSRASNSTTYKAPGVVVE